MFARIRRTGLVMFCFAIFSIALLPVSAQSGGDKPWMDAVFRRTSERTWSKRDDA